MEVFVPYCCFLFLLHGKEEETIQEPQTLINCTGSLGLWDLVMWLCEFVSSTADNDFQMFHFRNGVNEWKDLEPFS